MSGRSLLLGRAGTGKTTACLDLLTSALAERKRALLLVPTHAQAEHLKFRLLDRAGGLSAHAIVTFENLAERVVKARLSTLVPGAVRDRVAAEILPAHFEDAAAQPGFRAEFLAAVKEIKEQGAPVAETLAKARAHFPEDTRGRRLFEAYAAYVDALPGPDHEDLLLQTRDALVDGAPDLDLLLVDGFHDFTEVQHRIVRLLAARAAATTITLPLDPARPDDPVFATASRTAAMFDGFARRALTTNRRADGALAALEARLFRAPAPPIGGAGAEVIACASEEDEADRVARLVARAGRPFRDFLLVRRGFDGLHALYRAAFARHGVPLRFFGAEALGRTPAARAATLWLRHVATGGLDATTLLPLLRSPYFLPGPLPEEVDALAARLRKDPSPPDLAQFPALAVPEGRLPDLLRARFGVGRALLDCPDGDEEIARAARFFAALVREAESVADRPVAEAAERVARRVPLLKGHAPDRRHDCVYAVEALDARQWEKPVVIVTGLLADAFPRQVRQDLFLRDDEREALGAERGVHLPLRARREDEERYLFYVALTRARERLVLTYAAFDEEGTPRPPSPYLDEALAHLADVERRDVPLAEQYVLPRDATSPRDLFAITADGLARAHRGDGALAAALYERGAVDRARLAWPVRLELLRQRPLPFVPERAWTRLSATGMNNFQRCPYLHLMRYGLEVSPARPPALDPLRKGTIVHDVLEAYARDGGDPGALFDAVFTEQTAGLALGLDDEAARRWMRAAVVKAAARVDAADVLEPEKNFELPLGELTLRGRIDRVDRTPAGRLIVDYKTGKHVKIEKSETLEEAQLDLYLLAEPEAVGAVFDRLYFDDYAGFVPPGLAKAVRGRDVRVMEADELAARRARVRALAERLAARAREGRLAVHPRDPDRCKRGKCDGFDLCRVQRARWLAKAAREGGGGGA